MKTPRFTFSGYIDILKSLKDAGYIISSFRNVVACPSPCAIIRHDVDISLGKAVEIAKLEEEESVSATYFVMLSSAFYNIMDKENEAHLKTLIEKGHEIGLHFDISKYSDCDEARLEYSILREIDILSMIAGTNITSVSWHIPAKKFLGRDLKFLNDRHILNAYDPMFFNYFKYLSDSSMHWRDNPYDFIDAEKNPCIQVLMHPIWYSQNIELDAYNIIRNQLSRKSYEAELYLDTILPGRSA